MAPSSLIKPSLGQGPAVLHAEATEASGSTEVGEAGIGMDSRGPTRQPSPASPGRPDSTGGSCGSGSASVFGEDKGGRVQDLEDIDEDGDARDLPSRFTPDRAHTLRALRPGPNASSVSGTSQRGAQAGLAGRQQPGVTPPVVRQGGVLPNHANQRTVSSSAPAAGTLPVSTSGPHRSPSRGGEGKNSSTCTRSDTGNLWNSSS